jgi:integrase
MLNSHILPAWRDKEFISIKRSDITKLMDDVEDEHGARTADVVLTVFSAIANWYAVRHDDYSSPIIRGMRRQSTHAQARARILDDDEIRAIWKATETADTFGRIVRICLLTAQRRTKVAQMRWADISVDGEWSIPIESREKSNGGILQLPEAVLAIINAHRVGSYVFPGRFNGPFKGLSEAKADLDAKLPADMPGWTLHDLRRTARSLMSRAGVRPDIAERVLGHAIPGVHGTYDRHSYRDEKAEALRCLAALIESIVHPPASNVRPIRKAAR